MAFLLFFEPLLERVHDLVPVAQGLDLFHLLFGQEFLGHRLQPVFGHIDRVLTVIGQDTLENPLENLIEPVEHAFILHEGRAAEVIERLGRFLDHLFVQRFEERQMLLETGGNPCLAQLVDEIEEHGAGHIADNRARPASRVR